MSVFCFKAKQYHLTNNHLVLYRDVPYQHVEVCRVDHAEGSCMSLTGLSVESLYVVKGTWPEISHETTAPWVPESVSTDYSKLLLDTGRILYGHFGPLGPIGIGAGIDGRDSVEEERGKLICRDRDSRTYLVECPLAREVKLYRQDASLFQSTLPIKNKPGMRWALCHLLALAKQKKDLTLFNPDQEVRTWRRVHSYQVRYNPGKGYLLLLIYRDKAELLLLPSS